MIKMISLVPRKEGMSREAFIEHYENRHVPLVTALFPLTARYIRNYPVTENLHYAGSPGVRYDAVTEIWYASQSDYQATMADFAKNPEKFRLLAEDEERFCDKPNMVMFLVEEREKELA